MNRMKIFAQNDLSSFYPFNQHLLRSTYSRFRCTGSPPCWAVSEVSPRSAEFAMFTVMITVTESGPVRGVRGVTWLEVCWVLPLTSNVCGRAPKIFQSSSIITLVNLKGLWGQTSLLGSWPRDQSQRPLRPFELNTEISPQQPTFYSWTFSRPTCH